jgi:hypothetical protein
MAKILLRGFLTRTIVVSCSVNPSAICLHHLVDYKDELECLLLFLIVIGISSLVENFQCFLAVYNIGLDIGLYIVFNFLDVVLCTNFSDQC